MSIIGTMAKSLGQEEWQQLQETFACAAYWYDDGMISDQHIKELVIDKVRGIKEKMTPEQWQQLREHAQVDMHICCLFTEVCEYVDNADKQA